MSPIAAELPVFTPVVVHSPADIRTGHRDESSWQTYTVRPGDTLYDLAQQHGSSVASLVEHNDLAQGGRWIHPGQTIQVPGTASSSGSSSGTTSSSASDSSSSAGSSSSARSSSGSTSSAGAGVTVRAGDTLSHIAARHGVSVADLISANALSSAGLIYPGQSLSLPGSAGSSSSSASSVTAPYTPDNIGDAYAGQDVASTFLHYTYSDEVSRSAAANRDYLSSVPVPSRAEIQQMIVDTANRHGVDPKLMLAISQMESGWNHRAVSPANAIGAMQVIPSSGDWASQLVGQELNLLDPQDNITASTVIMRALLRAAENENQAIAGYYQGLAGVQQNGMYSDTEHYVDTVQALRRGM